MTNPAQFLRERWPTLWGSVILGVARPIPPHQLDAVALALKNPAAHKKQKEGARLRYHRNKSK
jgi:hypothetical protein